MTTQTDTAALDAWLGEHLDLWKPHYPAISPAPEYSTTGKGMLQLMNCDPPEPWTLHWTVQQYRDGYYGPWWAGCSVTPGWSSFTHPREWARHDDLPTAVALVLKQAWENKRERMTRVERAEVDERNAAQAYDAGATEVGR